MSQNSSIEWTQSTWNPITGCTRISDGCAHCYAEIMAKRLQAMGQKKYASGFDPTFHPQLVDEPLKWRVSQMIFVCSMGDLFHESIPDEAVIKVFEIMNRAYWHTFQVLTKRSGRLASLAPALRFTENIWTGVTVESGKYVHRIEDLATVPSCVRFLSVEPMLGPLNRVRLEGIHWVIAGGESGPGARPIRIDWVRDLRDRCVETGVPFFFKQWGGVNKKAAGRLLDGAIWDQKPKPVCVSA